MKNNYKELKNLLIDFIPERFTITWCKPDYNSKGITSFRFRIALNDFAFDVSCNISVFVPYRGFYFLNPGLAILVFMRVKKMFCGVNLF